MKYYSLKKESPVVSFEQATIYGQAPDKGLYFPESIPVFPKEMMENIEKWDDTEIAYQVMRPYVGDEIDEQSLRTIVKETIDFPIPLVKVTDTISTLELFHGPTLAFKDVGARFMSRCLSYFVKKGKLISEVLPDNNKKITVLVATSGDTGGAVAGGFHQVEGVDVVILFPSGKVSKVQEKQLTTFGDNIHALEVDGSFDDCQRLVKQAFTDEELKKECFLTSANSINVARWLPQQLYYLLAYKQWKKQREGAPVISVPSGNFGNICAGILAHISGMPAAHFIAACNANDVVPKFMEGQTYQPRKAIPTISNAMDVGDPSNFIRILELFHQDFPALKEKFSSVSISDDDTRAAMIELYSQHHYLADPHGAVGYLALKEYLTTHTGEAGMFLETAHPVKFYDVIEPVLNVQVPMPESVKGIMNKAGNAHKMDAEYQALREFLMNK
jgi:threonine synthase